MKQGQRATAAMAATILLGLSAVGCSPMKKAPSSDLEAQVRQQEKTIAALEADRKSQDKTVEQLESELQRQSRDLSAAQEEAQKAKEEARATGDVGAATTNSKAPELLPPGARAGECYARVFVPATYETDTVKVLKREAAERIEVIPATFEWVEERILVKEASERLEVVPATYEWVEEKIQVQPSGEVMEEVPASYETVTEKVLVKPAHTIWKKGRGPVEKIDEATGEIMCLVEVPAEYRTVTKRVLKSAAKTSATEVPAEYKTTKKQVLKAPASVRKVEIPAEYKTIKVRREVTPTRYERIPVPAEYQTVTRTDMVADGHLAWKPVLCETNMTLQKVTAVQQALLDAGHNPGPIDGIIGSQTLAAVRSYQSSKNLARGGLTLETLQSLGVPASAPRIDQADRR